MYFFKKQHIALGGRKRNRVNLSTKNYQINIYINISPKLYIFVLICICICTQQTRTQVVEIKLIRYSTYALKSLLAFRQSHAAVLASEMGKVPLFFLLSPCPRLRTRRLKYGHRYFEEISHVRRLALGA